MHFHFTHYIIITTQYNNKYNYYKQQEQQQQQKNNCNRRKQIGITDTSHYSQHKHSRRRKLYLL